MLRQDDIVHVATMLAVTAIERSVAFYRDRLGFQVLEATSDLALLRHGSMLLYLVTNSPPTSDKPDVWLSPPAEKSRTSFNLVFRVNDCRAVYEQMHEAGVQFLTPPHSPAWGGWRCFGRDPDGYLFEIEQA